MEYPISNKMAQLKPSAIREFFKYAADPTVISLTAGGPAPETIPVDMVAELMGAVLREAPMQALAYGQSEGYPPLRDFLREYLSGTHSCCGADDDLMILSGAQQAADLSCKVLCNEGDTVICENPSFTGVLNAFRSYGANLTGIPMEEDGISIEGLEHALKDGKNVRMIYVIPNCQNPTGITMSLEKRRQVYALAKRYGVMIYEDNPYGDLQFRGEMLPSIKSMDTDGLVIYAGTLSKILSPGIRVGYVVAPKGIFGRMVVGKQASDVHTNMLGQLLAHRFLTGCDLAAHLAGLRMVYARKCQLMLDEMDRHFPAGITHTTPNGGLFIWVDLPRGMDGGKFCNQLAEERKVAAVPGSAFATEPGQFQNAFRVNFSVPSDEQIITSMARCGQLLKEWVAK